MSQLPPEHNDARKGTESPQPFICKVPQTPGPFIFAAPHSGRHYPEAMCRATSLSGNELRLSEDAYVDQLFTDVPSSGATLLKATHARAYLDLNRAPDELDAGMFTPALSPSMAHETYRVKAGLGVIPRVINDEKVIYSQPLPAREAFFRIDHFYTPYHEKLQSLLDARRKQFGYAVLIDCHSMPSESGTRRRRVRHVGPEVVLGDNWGASCDRSLTSFAEDLLIQAGFNVRRNVPYSGGFTTQHYGNPDVGIHTLQIEISRAIYMNEQTLDVLPEFEIIKEKLQWFSNRLIAKFNDFYPKNTNSALPKAAE